MRKNALHQAQKERKKARPIVFFIDIDGTLTDGSRREEIMEEQGLVIGEYRDPNRVYPQGKEAFLEAFCNPDLFSTDVTMDNAKDIIQSIKAASKYMEIHVFYVTARDGKYHHETEQDLRERDLWVGGARLVCKPHRKAPKTVDYKVSVFATIVNALDPSNIVIIDNSQHILDGASRCFSISCYSMLVDTFTSCTDALNWWNSYVKQQKR